MTCDYLEITFENNYLLGPYTVSNNACLVIFSDAGGPSSNSCNCAGQLLRLGNWLHAALHYKCKVYLK